MINRQVRLRRHPVGMPTHDDFELVEVETPELREGEVLVRNRLLSLDPYMRGQMDPGPSYIDNVPPGGVLSAHTVGEVAASRSDAFAEGDFVWCIGGWQDYAVQSTPSPLRRIDPALGLAAWLGPLGLPGWTAFLALKQSALAAGETLVVSSAAGAVGGLVGQLARADGARVVGIAGGREKRAHVVEELGFDACIDYRSPTFEQDLIEATPNGIDVDFENVGGDILAAVWPRLNAHSRVIVSGLIAEYNLTAGRPGPDWTQLLKQRVRVEGFIISDHLNELPSVIPELAKRLATGKLKWRQSVTPGLENAPEAFIGMLQGRNFGKTLVEVAR